MSPAVVLAVVAALALQRALGAPGSPLLGAVVLLPMPWIVGPALRTRDRRWFVASFLLGVLWDAVVEEPVIGPGGIAWSAAAVVAWWLSATIADRGPRMWFVTGVAATSTMILARAASLAPLGLGAAPTVGPTVVTATVTGVLCAIVGWLFEADLPQRWRRYRSRRLH